MGAPPLVPRHIQVHAQQNGYDVSLWELSTADVAAAMHVTTRTVLNWGDGRRDGVRLNWISFNRGRAGRISNRVHRLVDLIEYAQLCELDIDYDLLPSNVQQRHQVGRFAPAEIAPASPARMEAWPA